MATLSLYIVNGPELIQACGSCDAGLYDELTTNTEFARYFSAYRRDFPEAPELEELVEDLLFGEVRYPDSTQRYVDALEVIAVYFSADPSSTRFDTSALDQMDAAVARFATPSPVTVYEDREGEEVATEVLLGMPVAPSLLVLRGAPVSLPQSDLLVGDLPWVGHLSFSEAMAHWASMPEGWWKHTDAAVKNHTITEELAVTLNWFYGQLSRFYQLVEGDQNRILLGFVK